MSLLLDASPTASRRACESAKPPLSVALTTDRTAALSAWRRLEQSLDNVPVCCSSDWTEAWLRQYGDLVLHRLIVATHHDALAAVALLTKSVDDSRGWWPISSWHLGTAGEPDADSVCVEYNGLLCRPADRAAVMSALTMIVVEELDADRFVVDGVAAGELNSAMVTSPFWQWTTKYARYCDLAALREKGVAAISAFGDSTRKGIRQNLRDYGPVTVEWADTAAAAHAVFDELIVLHQRRWTAVGEPGCYASRRFTAFHRELIDRLVPQGQMVLVRVRAGEQTLGCSQLLIDRHRVLVYQGGRLSCSRKHSPGLVTDYCCLRESLERGYDAFDFMAGDSIHKQRLTTHTAPLLWGERRFSPWKFAAIDTARRTGRAVRDRMRRLLSGSTTATSNAAIAPSSSDRR